MGKLIANPYAGYFIVFGGIDGSGKSTQAKLLTEALEKEEYPVLHTFEPTKEFRFGKLARSIYTSADLAATLPQTLNLLQNDEGYWVFRRHLDRSQKRYLERFEKIAYDLERGNYSELPYFIQICMTFDRLDHRMRVEIPKLIEGTHIISDRDFESTLAYGMSEGIPFQTLLAMQKDILGNTAIAPDIVILLDISPEAAQKRITDSRKSKERFDDKLEAVSCAYQEISLNPELNRLSLIVSIDGSLSEETVHYMVMRTVHNRMLT